MCLLLPSDESLGYSLSPSGLKHFSNIREQ